MGPDPYFPSDDSGRHLVHKLDFGSITWFYVGIIVSVQALNTKWNSYIMNTIIIHDIDNNKPWDSTYLHCVIKFFRMRKWKFTHWLKRLELLWLPKSNPGKD